VSSPALKEAPDELSISFENARAAASVRRAHSMRSAVGTAAGEGSCIPSSTSSAAAVSSGRPEAASSPVTRAMATVSATIVRSAVAEKSDV